MRFPILLLAGVVCIVLGVAGSEWSRRHPHEKPVPILIPLAPPLTAEELSATELLTDEKIDAEGLRVANAELTGFARDARLPEDFGVSEAKAVLAGSLFARNAVPHGNAVFLISEEGKQGVKQSLLRITASDLPKALVVHRPGIGAIAVEGSRLYWSEGGSIFSTDATLGGEARAVIRFPKGRITSLAVAQKVLIAALVPRPLDPFSSEPVGILVSVSIPDGKVKVLASQQVRPAEAHTDGSSVVWVGGYPADLWKVELPAGEPRLVSTRADGPVLLEDKSVTFRHPVTGAPELVRMGTDGTSVVLAKGEVERVTQLAGEVWFSVGGSVRRVSVQGEHEKAVAQLPHPVLELAVTDDALYAVIRQDSGGHLLLRLPRSTPEGSRP